MTRIHFWCRKIEAVCIPQHCASPMTGLLAASSVLSASQFEHQVFVRSYVAGDGSERHEVGVLENPGTPVEGSAVQGSYSYTSPDGTPVTVSYVADNFGFQPVGPNIHPAIIKAVQRQVEEARFGPPPPAFASNF